MTVLPHIKPSVHPATVSILVCAGARSREVRVVNSPTKIMVAGRIRGVGGVHIKGIIQRPRAICQ